MVRSRPAFRAVINGSTIAAGLTLRNRMPNRVRNETRTPEANARIHSPIGMNRKKMTRNRNTMNTSARMTPRPRTLSLVWTARPSMEVFTSPSSERNGGVLTNRPHYVAVPVALHHLDPTALRHVFAFGHHVEPLLADPRGA